MRKIEIWKIIIIIIGTAVLINFLRSYNTRHKALAPSEFRNYRKEFNNKIDTLNIKIDRANSQLDTLRLDVDSLKRNTNTLLDNNELIYYSLDSIKKGQIIIYREVRKVSDSKTLFEKIKLLLR